jgi:hypothetical protein
MRQTAEDQEGVALDQRIAYLAQQMHGCNVDRLYAPHVENDIAALAEFRLKGCVQLVLGAEKQTTLQLEDDRLAGLFFEQFHVLTQAHTLREAAATVHLATNHGAAQLFANEQEHGQGNTDARCRNQAVTHRHGDHRDDDDEIHHGPRRFEQVQTVPVDHPYPDDDQDAGQGTYRDPCDECAQGKKRHQRHDAFDDPGNPRLATARQIDQGCTHLACTPACHRRTRKPHSPAP